MSKRTFKHGWIPDVPARHGCAKALAGGPDGRDFLYGAIRPRLRPACLALRA